MAVSCKEPAKDEKCYRCKSEGHLVRECPAKNCGPLEPHMKMEGLKNQELAATKKKRVPSEERDEEAAPNETLLKRLKKEDARKWG